VLPEYLTKVGIPFHIENQDTYSTSRTKLRRARPYAACAAACAGAFCTAWLTNWAPPRLHWAITASDMLQTFFLNMFFGGKLKGMPRSW
jgi:tRNA 2-thiocytidine biosynthesis protein TtcA